MFNHIEIEQKRQKFWAKNKTFKVKNDFSKPKYYTLDMFPYPSGAGLHVGHPEGFTANDILARYKTANGFNVLHPMGWDAFGLPAENYAIKTGTNPRITTEENINNFRKQLKMLGFSYDWDREIDTTDPKYYKWTQWIFLKLFEAGLAYEQDLPINFCPSCKTGLANEEVLQGKCERCGSEVEKKKIRQWVLAITKYADRLEEDVKNLDWPKGIKDMQINWIGKSSGVQFKMQKFEEKNNEACISNGVGLNCPAKTSSENILSKNSEKETFIEVYTTRIDTVFGATYVVIAPDNEKVSEFITEELKEICENYISETKNKAELERTAENKEKTGVFSGSFVINPFSLEKIPVWIGDYVLGNYGTGAVMAVPAHDERDFEFAKKYNLPIKNSVEKVTGEEKEDEEFRRSIVALVENPKTGELLTLNWGEKLGGYLLIGGGIEGDENIVEAAKREILEETGYKNIKLINSSEKINHHYFAFLKNKARYIHAYGFHFELIDDEKIKQNLDEAEKGKFKIEWISKNELGNKIKDPLHNYLFEHFINGKINTEDGILVNSGNFSGLTSEEAREKLAKFAEENGFGGEKINYKLRDWLFSRQRYWGEPIPLIHIENEEFEKLEKIKSEDSNSFKEGVTQNGNTAKSSLSEKIIIESIIKVKKTKEKKKFVELHQNIQIAKGEIRFNGKSLIKHFHTKSRNEINFRTTFGETILKYLDQIFYESELVGYIAIRNNVFRIILKKISNKVYEVKTFYKCLKFTKVFNKAYIKEIGEEEFLFVKGSNFSKIYDGIYTKIICDYELPLKLPEVKKYEPSSDGTSPLANVQNFVNIQIAENLSGKRETNTMPQWAGSCWYYLRFMDPENDENLVNPEVEKYWGQVDSYVGGAEHAVLHLLYARFWHKFLFDIGVVSNDEPFYRLRNQGMILAYAFQKQNGGLVANDLVEEKDGEFFLIESGEKVNRIISKMSKSLKNVINPDDVIKEFGADTLRIYEMTMGEFADTKPWDTRAIIGSRRFLDKFYDTANGLTNKFAENDNEAIKLLHKTIKKVGEDIENYKFNTAISQMIILLNYGRPKDENIFQNWLKSFCKILNPFAPHITEEIWIEVLKNEKSLFGEIWPKYDENLVKDDFVIVGIQVNGKVRGELQIGINDKKEEILEKAKNVESVVKWLEGKEIVKEIFVPGKIIGFVVK